MKCKKCGSELVENSFYEFVNCYCENCNDRFTYNAKKRLIYSRSEKELGYKKFIGKER